MKSSTFSSDALAGKVALVTGGGTGIGRATAKQLASVGAKVVVTGRTAGPLHATVSAIEAAGGIAMAVPGDLREATFVAELTHATVVHFGKIDILINNAGGQFSAPAESISANGWNAVYRTSVETAWNLSREVANATMIPNRAGLIVFLAFSPRRGIRGMVHATSARAALENLASGLSLEWSRFGIRSVAVAPGTILTEGLSQYSEEDVSTWESAVPLGRLGNADDVSGVITFLATPAARYITGTTIVVDGGSDAWGSGAPVPPQEPVNS